MDDEDDFELLVGGAADAARQLALFYHVPLLLAAAEARIVACMCVMLPRIALGRGSITRTRTSKRSIHYYRTGLCSRTFVPAAFGPGTIGGFCPGPNG